MKQKASLSQEHPLFDNLYGAVRAYEFYFAENPEIPVVPLADMKIIGAIGVYSTLNGESGTPEQDVRSHFRITESLSAQTNEQESLDTIDVYHQIVSSLEAIKTEPCLKRFGAIALRYANPLLHQENRPLLGGIAVSEINHERKTSLFISRNLALYVGAMASRLVAERAYSRCPSDELREITNKLAVHSYDSQKIRTASRTVIKHMVVERLPEEAVLRQELQVGARVLAFPEDSAKNPSLAA